MFPLMLLLALDPTVREEFLWTHIVHFMDGSSCVIDPGTAAWVVTTKHGKLTLPLRDLEQVELAPRLSVQNQATVNRAIEELAAADFRVRESASTTLLKLGRTAVPALLQAQESADAERARRAQEILGRLNRTLPAEAFRPRSQDRIITHDMKLTGTISTQEFAVHTRHKPSQTLRLETIVRIERRKPEPRN
jgi:hypothetical protein